MSTRPRAVSLVLLALLVVALGAIGWGQWWLHQQHRDDDRAAAAQHAATDTVTAVLSYDYRRLRADIDATEPLLTGDAKAQYADLSAPLLKTAPPIHAVMQAAVKSSTVLESSASSARVLLFVDQTASSTKLAKPQLDQSRILVTMKHTNGTWLVADLSAI